MKFSVLVVDDHAAWRERLCLELQRSSRWHVVGEAADGVEAIRQAEALTPDLILLDIGLPSLNGLEAAQQIVATNPSARILFLSEYRSLHIVEAALATGARGYLCKTDGAARLLVAMDAIMEGACPVTAGLGREILAQTLWDNVLQEGPGRHVAAVYADTESLLDDYARFAEVSLAAGNVFVLLADDSRRKQLHERLLARGIAVDRFAADGNFVFVDSAAALSQAMRNGQLDETRLQEAAVALCNRVARTAAATPRRIAFCGEGAPCVFTSGDTNAALCIERVWNEIAKTWAVDSLCAYDAGVLRREGESRDAFLRICAEHSAVHFRSHSAA